VGWKLVRHNTSDSECGKVTMYTGIGLLQFVVKLDHNYQPGNQFLVCLLQPHANTFIPVMGEGRI
jgi:hypothetical protein